MAKHPTTTFLCLASLASSALCWDVGDSEESSEDSEDSKSSPPLAALAAASLSGGCNFSGKQKATEKAEAKVRITFITPSCQNWGPNGPWQGQTVW
mmetsp:Transcript_94504/g.225225  ORF Transcript_94504/g.225225 Transcript_94504/m.225225 type:complete len:96 (+) Transcript_94504:903-1190(+)